MTPGAPTTRDRLALVVMQVALVGVVLAALPYKLFDLDRFFVPKELLLHATAAISGALLLSGRRRLSFTTVDLLLTAFLGLSVVSALFATNGWVAWRAVALSCSGIVLFWCASALRDVGLGRQLLGAAVLATVAGAATALTQAYAGPVTDLFSLNRAPGGTFGNRNFMAHLCAIGAPAIVLTTLCARRSWGTLLGLTATMVIAAALVVSRSRAAWLALAVGILAIGATTWVTRVQLRGDGLLRRAMFVLAAATLGALGAAFLPNRLEWKSASPYLDTVRGVVNYRDGSGRGRLVQYTNSLGLVRAHPLLGVGPGNWPVDYPRLASQGDPSLADDAGMTDNPWPSSDWIAFLTERGGVATVCLALAFIALLGWSIADVRRSSSPEMGDIARAAGGLILIGTLTTTIVAGAFDAALLLAIPTMVVWVVVGALAPPGVPLFAIERGVRRFASVVVLVACGTVGVRSGLQWAAMAAANGTTRVALLEHAAALDPGSYKIRIRTAQAGLAKGDCHLAAEQARAAARLFPSADEPKALLRRCR